MSKVDSDNAVLDETILNVFKGKISEGRGEAMFEKAKAEGINLYAQLDLDDPDGLDPHYRFKFIPGVELQWNEAGSNVNFKAPTSIE